MTRSVVILLADGVPDEDCRQDEQLPGLRQAETPLPSRRPSKLAHGMRLARSLSPIKFVPALLPSNAQCREPFGALDLPSVVFLLADGVAHEDCRQDEQLPGLRQAETPLPSRRPSKLAHGMRLARSLSPTKFVPALLPSNTQCREPFGALDLHHTQIFYY